MSANMHAFPAPTSNHTLHASALVDIACSDVTLLQSGPAETAPIDPGPQSPGRQHRCYTIALQRVTCRDAADAGSKRQVDKVLAATWPRRPDMAQNNLPGRIYTAYTTAMRVIRNSLPVLTAGSLPTRKTLFPHSFHSSIPSSTKPQLTEDLD
ncbi:hypothetical protein BKA80DRAFT_147799 [Phyllosticta citrichinensis]